MINERNRIIPEEENDLEAKDWVGKRLRVREECLGRWGVRKSQERSRKIALKLYIEIHNSRWIKRCPKESDLDGSRSYPASIKEIENFLMDREAIETNSQKSRWIEIAIIAIEKGSSKGSIDSLAVEGCLVAVKIAQKQFLKKRKTQIQMQSIMPFNQRSKQHFKLSKSSFNKKNVKHLDPKHTHTHTHTKQV